MSCFETLQDYGLRAVGIGERLLPKTDFTLCEHVVLIGSGMIWNLYFAFFALLLGFFLAIGLATSRASANPWLRLPAQSFIFVIRGSPLFIQFFIAYETFVLIPKLGYDLNLGFIEITVETRWLTKAWLGALIVLFLNTSAYTAQIFYGALQAIPRGDIEAADAIGMSARTMQRKLSEDDAVFQDLVDQARRELAERLLRTTSYPLVEIAFLTGFAEQSGFTRAFKRWAGETPRSYRLSASATQ